MYIRKHEKKMFSYIHKKEMSVGIHPLTYNRVM